MSHFIPQPCAQDPPNTVATNTEQDDGPSGPNETTRQLTYEFYLWNTRFVRSLETEHDLCYFYNIWVKSDGASTMTVSMEYPDQTSPPFNEVIRVFTEHFQGKEPVLSINTYKGCRKLSWISDKIKIHFRARRRPFPVRKAYHATPDRADGTERVARNWAKRFYTDNVGFLRNAIHNRKALAYFYKIWRHSPFATLSGFFAEYDRFHYRHFSQILFALVNDGRVCRVSKSRDTNVNPIIWMTNQIPNNPPQYAQGDHQSFNSKMISRVEFAREIQDAVTSALSEVFERSMPPLYTPTTPPRSREQFTTALGNEPPKIRRISRSRSVYSDEENDTCGTDLIITDHVKNE